MVSQLFWIQLSLWKEVSHMRSFVCLTNGVPQGSFLGFLYIQHLLLMAHFKDLYSIYCFAFFWHFAKLGAQTKTGGPKSPACLPERSGYFHSYSIHVTFPHWHPTTKTYTPSIEEYFQQIHTLIMSDSSHWLQMKPISSPLNWAEGAADSSVYYPSVWSTAPIRYPPCDPSLHNALKIISSVVVSWKYLPLLKFNNTAPCYYWTNVSIPLHVLLLHEAKKTSCQETEH